MFAQSIEQRVAVVVSGAWVPVGVPALGVAALLVLVALSLCPCGKRLMCGPPRARRGRGRNRRACVLLLDACLYAE